MERKKENARTKKRLSSDHFFAYDNFILQTVLTSPARLFLGHYYKSIVRPVPIYFLETRYIPEVVVLGHAPSQFCRSCRSLNCVAIDGCNFALAKFEFDVD